MNTLKAPFPYFGAKSRVADVVWQRFGRVDNYVEPFFGSGAVLLGCPHPVHTETVNDLDCLLANFWRALQADPERVAYYADYPVSEVDLHARHKWLVSKKPDIRALLADPDAYDVKAAGWWVWGASSWIGSGWCAAESADTRLSEQLPHVGDAGRGIHAARGGNLHSYFTTLAARLRRVRVCCGDWQRVLGPSVTTKHGTTAIFLDPPYERTSRADVYTHEGDVFADVQAWATANGDNPLLRIAICGYFRDGLFPDNWEVYRWKANGGYGLQGTGRGRANADKECIWFSPHCMSVYGPMFAMMEALQSPT